MDNSEIILLKEGISPNVDLLSPIEEESILGGATKCDQGYRHSLFIGTKCDCGYDNGHVDGPSTKGSGNHKIHFILQSVCIATFYRFVEEVAPLTEKSI